MALFRLRLQPDLDQSADGLWSVRRFSLSFDPVVDLFQPIFIEELFERLLLLGSKEGKRVLVLTC